MWQEASTVQWKVFSAGEELYQSCFSSINIRSYIQYPHTSPSPLETQEFKEGGRVLFFFHFSHLSNTISYINILYTMRVYRVA
jgi:hypothetical protein